MAGEANPSSENPQLTLLFFTFTDAQDQIIASGAGDYPPTATEFNTGQPVVRAIFGSTGKYIGAVAS